jgi:hypothetical protein
MIIGGSVLFWILIGWGLYDTSIYLKEALIWAAFWTVFLVGSILWFGTTLSMVCIGGLCLIDVALVIKFIGNPSVT